MTRRLAILPPSFQPIIHILKILGNQRPLFLTQITDLPDQATDDIMALIQSRTLTITEYGTAVFFSKE
ncbi:hypothetical protein [Paenibacillus sp. RC67]|uniref:hypothetical protein n=1 Tax=Paenibacillus sp. RC67 TaxID=3039392 RepID=UPI0024AE1995|nr:hypothetical protein [Paenibacillus sp. RC67]